MRTYPLCWLLLFLASCVARTDTGAAPFAGSVLTVAPQQLASHGTDQATVTLFVRDAQGASQTNISVAFTGDEDGVTITQPANPTDENGGVQGKVSCRRQGVFVLGATVSDGHAGPVALGCSATLICPGSAPAHRRILLQVLPEVDTVDTATPRQIIAQVVEPDGSAAAGVQLSLYSSRIEDTVAPAQGETDSTGTFRATLVSTRAGSPDITASLSVDKTVLPGSAKPTFLAGAPEPALTEYFLSTPGGVLADGTFTTTLQILFQDKYHNPASGIEVSCLPNKNSLLVDPPSGFTDADGVFHSTLSGTELGPAVITIKALETSADKAVVLVAGPPNALASSISVSPAVLVANGVSSTQLELNLKDAAGHPLVGETIVVTGTQAVDTLTSDNTFTDAEGRWTAALSSTLAGPRNLIITARELQLGRTVQFIPGSISSVKSTFSAEPNTFSADGQSTMTLCLRDNFANPIAGQAVTLGAADGLVTLSALGGTSQANGCILTTATSQRAGAHALNASFGRSSLSTVVQIVAQEAFTGSSSLLAAPATVLADGNKTSAITVTVQDQFNNPCVGLFVTLASSAASSQLSLASGVTDLAGRFTAQLTNTLAQTVQLTAQAGNLTLQGAATFVAGPPSPVATTLVATPSTASASTSASVVLVARVVDAQSNPIVGRVVALVSSRPSDIVQPSSGPTDANGAFVTNMAGTVAGLRSIGLFSAGSLLAQANVTLAAGPADGPHSSIKADGTSLVADSNDGRLITLRLGDAYNNPVGSQVVHLVASLPGAQLVAPTGLPQSGGSNFDVLTAADGLAQVRVRSVDVGPLIVTASSGDLSQSLALDAVPGAPDPLFCSMSLTPNTIAAGSGPLTVTVQAADAFGHPVFGAGVSLTSVSGNTTLLPAGGNTVVGGLFVARLVSTSAGSQVLNISIAGQGGSSSITLTAPFVVVAGQINRQNSQLVVAGPQAVADGSSQLGFTLTTKDAFGNPLGGVPVSLTVSGTGGQVNPSTGTTSAAGTFTAAVTSLRAEDHLVTAQAMGMAFSAVAHFVPGPLSLASSTLTLSPNMLAADGFTTALVQLSTRDATGNALAGQAVTLSATAHGFTFAQTTGATDDRGLWSTTASTTVAEPKQVVASLSGSSLAANIIALAGPASSTKSSLTLSSSTLAADNNQTAVLTATVMDALSNPLVQQPITFSAERQGVTLAPLAAVTDSSGRGRATVLCTTNGNTTLTARAANITLAIELHCTAGGPSIVTSTLQAQNSAAVADGVSSIAFTLVARDEYGNLVPSLAVTFTTGDANDTLQPSATTTDVNGAAFTVLTAVDVGPRVVHATFIAADGTAQSLVRSVQFITPDANSTLLTLVASPNVIAADGYTGATLTAVSTTGLGQPVVGMPVTIVGGTASTNVTPGSGITDANGTFVAVLRSTQAKIHEAIAQLGNVVARVQVQATPGNANGFLSSWSANISEGVADGQTAARLTAVLRDDFGNPLNAASVAFAIQSGSGSLSQTSSITDEQGRVLVQLTSLQVGELQVTAFGGGLSQVLTLHFGAGPIDTTHSTTVLSPNVAVADGNNNLTVTVLGADAQGHPRPGAQVQLSGQNNSVVGLPASAALDSNGLATFVLGSTVAQSSTLFVAIDGATFSLPLLFVAGPAVVSNTQLSLWPQEATADGNAIVGIKLNAADAHNNLIGQAQVTASCSDSFTDLFASRTTTLADGSWQASLTSTHAGSPQVTVQIQGLTLSVSPNFLAGPAVAGHTKFVGVPHAAVADGQASIPLELVARDVYDNPVPQLSVTLSTGAGGQLLIQPSDGTTSSSGTFAASVTSTVAEVKTIVANVGNLVLTQDVLFTVGPPSAFTSTLILTPNSIIADGSSATTIIITARDAQGNPVVGLDVPISVSGGNNLLVRGQTNTDASGSVVAAVSSTLAQNKDITASVANFVLTGQVVFQAGPASSAASNLTVAPASIIADGQATAAITLLAKDVYGNIASNQPVMLSVVGRASALSPAFGITDANGQFNATVGSTVAESKSLTATLGATSLTTTVLFVPGAPSTFSSQFNAIPAHVVADGTSQASLQLQVQDALGNPIPNIGVLLAVGGGNNTLGQVPATTDGSGRFATTLASTLAQTKSLQATVAGKTFVTYVAFVAGTPSNALSSLLASPNVITADGTSTSSIVLFLRDDQGNLITDANVVLSAPGATLSATTNITNSSGMVGAQLSATSAGEKTVAASAGSTTFSTAVRFVPGAANSAASSISASPSVAQADDVAQINLRVLARDAFLNPIGLQLVTLTASGQRNTFAPISGLTSSDGTWTTTLTSSRAQSKSIVASLGAAAVSCNVTFSAGPPSASNSTFIANPNLVLADGVAAAQLVLTVVDVQGNPVAGQNVDYVAGGSANLLSSSQATSGVDGTAVVSLRSTLAETKLLSAQLAGLTFTTHATFMAGSPSGQYSSFTASPNVAVADGNASITLLLTTADMYNNPRGGQSVALSLDGCHSLLSLSTGLTDMAGRFYATLTSTQAQEQNVFVNVANLTRSVGVAFVAGAMSSATSSLVVTPNEILADGNSRATLGLVARDAQGNPLVGRTAYFASAAGGLDSLSASSAVTDVSGQASVTISSTSAGMTTVSVTVGSNSISAPLVFDAGAPSAATSFVVITPSLVTADGNSVASLTVQVEDLYGNPTPGQTVSLSASGMGYSFQPASGITDSAGRLTSMLASTVAEPKVVNATLGTTALGANITFVAGAPSTLASSLTASPSAATADGNASVGLVLVLLDAHNNPVVGRAVGLSVSGSRNSLSKVGGLTDASGRFVAGLTSTKAEFKTIIGSTAGMSVSTGVNFAPGAPSSQTTFLTASPNSLAADANQPFVLALWLADAQGNPVPAQTANFVSSNSNDIITPPTGASNANGILMAGLVATQSGQRTVVAQVVGLTRSVPLYVAAGAPNASFSSLAVMPNQVVADGTSAASVRFSVFDVFGNPAPDQLVSLSATGGATTVVSPSSGKTDASGTATFSISATLAASRALSAQAGNVLLGASLNFVPGPISNAQSSLVLSPGQVVANGSAKMTVAIKLADLQGNPIPGQTLSLTSSGATDIFDSANGMTDANGLFNTAFSSTSAGSKNVLANVSTTSLSAQANFVAGPVAQTTSNLMASPNSFIADDVAAATVTLNAADAFNNPAKGQMILWSSSGSQVHLSSTTTTTNSQGITAITVRTPVAQGIDLYATAANTTLTAHLNGVAGGPSSSMSSLVATPNNNLVADGNLRFSFVGHVADAHGNPVASQPVNFSVSGLNAFLSRTTAVTDANGQVNVSLAATRAETKIVTLGAASASVTASVTFVSGEPNGVISTIDVSPNQVVADGQTQLTATLTSRDAFANAVSNRAVTWTTLGNQVQISASTGTTDSAGKVSTTLKSTFAQTSTVTANCATATSTATISFTAGSPNSAQSTFVALPNSGVAADNNTTSRLVASILDSFGNPVAGQNVTLSANGNSLILSPSSGLTDATGTFVGLLTSTVADTKNATMSASNFSKNLQIGFVAGPPDTNASSIAVVQNVTTGQPNIVIAGNLTRQTVYLKDAYGNAAGGQNVVITTIRTDTNAGANTSTGQTDANGFLALFTYSPQAAAERFSKAVSGNARPSVTWLVVATSPNINFCTLAASPNPAAANGNYASAAIFTVKDRFSNVVANQNITWTITPASVLKNTAQGTSIADGTTKILLGVSTAQNITVKGAFTGTPSSSLSTPIRFLVPGPIDTSKTVIAGPTTPQIAGAGTINLSVSVFDSNYVPLSNQNASIAVYLNSNSNPLTDNPYFSQNGKTDFNGNFTGGYNPTAVQTRFTIFTVENGNYTQSWSVAPAQASSTYTSLIASPNTLNVDDTGSMTINLAAQDSWRNLASFQNVTWVPSSASLVISANSTVTDANGMSAISVSSTQSQVTYITIYVGKAIVSVPISFLASSPNAINSRLSMSPNVMIAGQSANSIIVATFADKYNNVCAFQPANLSISGLGLSLNQVSSSLNDVGQVTYSLAAPTLSGTVSVVAGSGNVMLSGSIKINSGPAKQIAMQARTSSFVGIADYVSVAAQDLYGNIDTNYRGTVSFSSSDLMATLPTAHAFSVTDAGFYYVSERLTWATQGNQTIYVGDGIISGRQNVTVGAPPAVYLTFSSPVSAGSLCLQALNASSSANTLLVAGPCNGGLAAVMAQVSDTSLRLLNQCIEPAGDIYVAGQNIILQPCSANINQHWSVAGGQIKSMANVNFCLLPPAQTSAFGTTPTTLALCSDANTQTFSQAASSPSTAFIRADASGLTLVPANESFTAGTMLMATPYAAQAPLMLSVNDELRTHLGLCLDTSSGSAAAGANVLLAGCTGSISQKWAIGSSTIRPLGDATLCVDAASGQQAKLAVCSAVPSQRWVGLQVAHTMELTAQLANGTRQCMQLASPSQADNGNLGLAPCNASSSQQRINLVASNANQAVAAAFALLPSVVLLDNAGGGESSPVKTFVAANNTQGLLFSPNASMGSTGLIFTSSPSLGVGIDSNTISAAGGVVSQGAALTEQRLALVPLAMRLSPTQDSNFCLAGSKSGYFAQSSVVFVSCSAVANQSMLPLYPPKVFAGSLSPIMVGGLCLTGAAPNQGGALSLAPCSYVPTQLWTVGLQTGALSNAAGGCIDGSAAAIQAGIPSMVSCTSGVDQLFEKHF